MRTNYLKSWTILALSFLGMLNTMAAELTVIPVKNIYIDSVNGNDQNDGLSEQTAWASFDHLKKGTLDPGSTLYIKRGSSFNETLLIEDSGSKDQPILVTSYGDENLQAPSFTNPIFDVEAKNFGNCIRLRGDYIIVENMYCHHSAAEVEQGLAQDFPTMWELGAIYVDKGAEHCIIRNNEMFDCGVGVKSYGAYCLIEHNYVHDCNRVLGKWTWGPIGIWLGGDHQEVRYNTIINYRAEDERIVWSGADGGAMEVDDARIDKSDISIHHNYSRDCQGFLETTGVDEAKNPAYIGFRIHHNVSDDYQSFVLLWRGARCQFYNNTIIRRKENSNDLGVFIIEQFDAENEFVNNIVVTEKGLVVWAKGNTQCPEVNVVRSHNLYYAADGNLNMGFLDGGKKAVYADPMFVHYENGMKAEDFKLKAGSPAIRKGKNSGFSRDFEGKKIRGAKVDLGAYEK